jgi:peptidoglycan/xylan/chitin deacetylase (PgdA/CDA1 family)
MNFYWIKTNVFIKRIFNNYVWDIPNSVNKVYLTFDDGPTPEITEWTLNQLKKNNAKGTFFCIGDNIRKYPEIFNKVIQEGHSIGNHTFNHINGWKTKKDDYLENINLCTEQIHKSARDYRQADLFRPPYGKIKPSQAKSLRRSGYKIIMWDIISADFDQSISPEKCLQNVISNLKPGSVIVFHDSVKSFKNLEYVLPKTLEFIKDKGYNCEVIL